MKSFINDDFDAYIFDLDGTLYDEYDFIRQAYRPVSRILSDGVNTEKMYETLCEMWLNYGSSANIFQMAYEKICNGTLSDDLRKKCVNAFRNSEFELVLSQRVIDILEALKDKPMAIITDGDGVLQRRKYKALKLDQWIKEDYVFVSSDHGNGHYKPDPYMGKLAKEKLNADRIVYFGDRQVDEDFAKNAGFEFRKVRNMIEI